MVEGVTDELALTFSALRLGRNLKAEGVSAVPIALRWVGIVRAFTGFAPGSA